MDQEQALRLEAETAKQQLEKVLSSISDGFYVLDRQWRYTYVNDRLCELARMTRAEMLGHSIWDLFPDVINTDVYVQFHRALDEQVAGNFEYFYATWNRWYEYRLYPSLDGLTVFATDITDRKQTELILIEQNKLLELTASGQPLDECLSEICISISKLNPGTRACILLANREGLKLSDSITPELPPSFGLGLKDAPITELTIGTCGTAGYCGQPVTCDDIAGDKQWSPEWQNLCVSHGVLACHSVPILDVDGIPLGSLMLCFNEARMPTDWEYQLASFGTQIGSIVFEREACATKVVRANLALGESEEQYRTLFESIDEGFCVCEMLVDENGKPIDYRFLQVNPVFEKLTGLKEATGKTARFLVPDLEAFWFEVYGKVVLTGEPIRFEQESIAMNAWFDVNAFRIGAAQSHKFAVLFTNISEAKRDEVVRKESETALRQSEARLSTIAANLPNGAAFIVDRDLRYLFAEGKALETAGMTSSDLVGKTLGEALDPILVARYEPHYRQALSGEPYSLEHYSHDRHYISHGTPLYNDFGEVYAVLAVSYDITERKQAEEALQQRETELTLITNAVPALISFVDSDQRYRFNNRGYEEWFGHSATEIYGKHIQEVLGEAAYQEIFPYIEQVLAGQQVTFEKQVPYQDGGTRYVSATYIPRLNNQGIVDGFVALINDMSDRKRADERLHLLYETTRDLLATKQPLLLMSNLFHKLSEQLELHCYYNYMVEEKDNRQMLHLRNYEGVSDEAAESLAWIELGDYLCGLVAEQRQQIVLNQEQIATHPNAQLVNSMGITAYAGQPLIAQGQLLGTLSFASLTRTSFTPEEIDLLQSTCEQVAIAIERANLLTSIQQQAEQLQQANRIKDEFLAIVSHELRSPLNPILGWSTLLQTQKLDQTKTTYALKTIARNAKLQAELIEDLLDISRILRGKLSLNICQVNLVSIVEAAIETVQLSASAKSIQIHTQLESNVGLVSGDSSRLQQVVWNLLSNAVKFTEAGGQVEIRLQRNGSFAQISVSDTGKGISPDFLPYVFDYFRQEDGATTRKFGGLGLGLAIVRHLLELHGGTIEVESPGEGKGATFTVKLPSLPNSIHTSFDNKSSERSLNLEGIEILVVDDAADTREYIAFLLETYGANVTAVASAVEALATLAKSKVDVLVSDIGMPEMNGYMLMQQLRTLPSNQGGKIPAIALTAYAGEIDYQLAMSAGFQRHIPKPVEPTRLVEAIVDLLRS
jgi:PAS domain S-box-containing protein